MIRKTNRMRPLAGTALALVLVGVITTPVQAQEKTSARLDKVEAEVRALQRKVFPGPEGKYFTAEITPPANAASPAPTPSTTPVTDLLNRMDALESQVARLTSQVEQNTNRISQIEARLGAGAPAAAAMTTPTPASAPSPELPSRTENAAQAPAANLAAMSGGASSTPTPAPRPASPSAARLAAVKAIVKPQTDDPGDDEYSYGYRLWDAKFYPEAEQQLKLMLEKYPKHRRASWARNLIGRAYLDDGNPAEAAKWFLQNYQTDKHGERAPDSLLYLAATMKQLKDTKRACIALAEFSTTYAAEAAGRLKSTYDDTRRGLDCSG